MARTEATDFAGLLRQFRTDAALTQEELAETAQLSPKAISSLERGIRTRPHKATLDLLSGALNLSDLDRERLVAAARGGSRSTEPAVPLPVGAFLGSAPSEKIIARDAEFATLCGLLDESMAGAGRLAALAGEAGVGKTRLGQEVSMEMMNRGFLTVAGRCYEPNSAVPYFPFLEALSNLAAGSSEALRSEIPERWPQLGLLVPELTGASTPAASSGPDEQSLIFRSVAGFISQCSQLRPVGILLDDLHWADESSLRLLGHVARALRADRVFLMVTYRDLEVGRNHPLTGVLHNLDREGLLTTVRVECLDREGSFKLIQNMTATSPLTQDIEESVYRRAEGNPYFVRHLVDAMTQPPATSTDAAGVPVPAGIRSIVTQRVNRLDPQTQDILSDAAVLGQTFWFEDLQESSDRTETEVELALEAGARIGIVRETKDDSFEFDHSITQQTLYEDIPTRRRKRLHSKAGEVIAASAGQWTKPRAAEVAWHLVQGGDTSNALIWSLTAGREAWGVAALTEVEYHYRTALELAVELNDAASDAQARDGLGRLYHVLARHEEARDMLLAADLLYEAINDNVARGRLAIDLGAVYFMEGSPGPGIQCLQDAIARLQDTTIGPNVPTPIPELYVTLGDFLWPMGRRDEALEANTKAVETAGAANDVRMRVLADMQRVRFLEALGQRRDALKTAEAALPAIRDLGDKVLLWYALQVLTAMYWIRGRLDESRAVTEEALAIAIQIGDAEYIAGSKALLGRFYAWTGGWPEAERLLDEAASESAIGDHVMHFILCLRAELRMWRGEWETARADLTIVLEGAEASGNVDRIAMAVHLLAEDMVLRGAEPEAALEQLVALAARPGFQADSPEHGAVMAATLMKLGRFDDADSVLKAAIQTARDDDLALPLMTLLRLHAELLTQRNEFPAAEAALAEGLAAGNSTPAPYIAAQITLQTARTRFAAGHDREARETFDAALASLERLGVHPSAIVLERSNARQALGV